MTEPVTDRIHPSAVVHPSAQIADDVCIGPYALVGAHAVIGRGCLIDGHAVIGPFTTLGARNRVHHHAVLGTDSQDVKFHGETSYLLIGDDNVFREFVTVNRATGAGRATRIGNRCRMLAYSHVAHNTTLGDGVVLANCAEVGGECYIDSEAILGGLVGIHQFCRVGAYAIVGACSKVTQDILPFVTADGHPARPHGLNAIGLKRHGFSEADLALLKDLYRVLFGKGMRFEEAIENARASHGGDPLIARVLEFVAASNRGISRPRKSAEGETT